ncbi:hypothetical protein DNTS_029903 [Danionella cerebrum]|uniref:Chromatin target of PRMT1 protein C-terminal domain-containing protein n=1 Tax=Danionella cerebrum TaxID=2873325 RepID=A0A553RLR2_9TELE|nr:hypothetical protein DNTS_029903 [Danionella translucida]
MNPILDMMNPVGAEKVSLSSTCSVSLNDRFTFLMKHQTEDAINQQNETSLRNKRLALEMASRPSVLAALHDTSNINNQLCKANVKSRLGRPTRRGGLQMRGGGRNGRKGMIYTNRLQGASTPQTGWNQRQPASKGNSAVPMRAKGATAVSKTGRGCLVPVKRANSGFGRVRCYNHRCRATFEQLDQQLKEYMSQSKRHLDTELDAYMAQVDLKDLMQ